MNQQKFLTGTPAPAFIGKYGFAFVEKPNESEKGWFRVEMTDGNLSRATATVRFNDHTDKSNIPEKMSHSLKMFKDGNVGVFLAEMQFVSKLLNPEGRDKNFSFHGFNKEKLWNFDMDGAFVAFKKYVRSNILPLVKKG